MKTIINSLLAIFFSGIVTSGFTYNDTPKTHILIQSVDKNLSPALLSQSAKIITERLNYFCPDNFELKLIPGKSQIDIGLIDSRDLEIIEDLIIHKGVIEFYKVYNHNDLLKLLNNDNHLFSILNSGETDSLSGRVGCLPFEELEKVNNYIKSLKLDQKCKFAWTQNFDRSKTCLLPLKIDGNNPIIKGNDIDSAYFNQSLIYIKLKKQAVDLWAKATRKNIGNSIAIVLDNNVLSYPKVMSPIDFGEIEISGSYTETQCKYIASMIDNGELPVNFYLVK